ncbi:hypothetical protein PNI0076_02267 [Streptococcus pneumoniae PNI0076]|nr:hypothetical protein PNI0006_01364 [Streptococcus pneumoniae PNI0006]ELU69582.1 hypothetical protein PCS81218_00975 [Streptococcus pneumoniae PCS81218]ELU77538.1 hypothetical protein PNI0009_01855 [Streptococcus pneumoniae PNI0009]ELU78827.1 hypothetical protein PNI0076_02267 [Streptococcus pneumoniae PNI0076]ELU80344.1 hypothetical protein PNI0153_00544 [Streptococcus pneumoniae PNI0153]ELU87930.1 hypothetical protein PNI0199_00273 [Streptococcus pneumoniae PNI0199]ELU91472.1 hypothetical
MSVRKFSHTSCASCPSQGNTLIPYLHRHANQDGVDSIFKEQVALL